ncbi:flagellar hook-length control protein FliK [Desulfovibrio litoralis]|uniref:Hook-length control protein FliK n=1 Tax=Desulfovibrio litoralis DSM 11393 TaxID=1121455 RepID=A0A1M7S8V1_9BACT|nr:flagellar hook-length control protein FliK [Desulfovibrio litoralis]SHN54906.1 hook-length control protein FliK [Desulfovibrio litoralis DSM 11393]
MQVLPSVHQLFSNDQNHSESHSTNTANDLFNNIFSREKNAATNELNGPLKSAMRTIQEQRDNGSQLTGYKDLRFSPAELSQISASLRKKGVNNSGLEQIDQIIAGGAMPTLGQLIQSLRHGGVPIEFSDAEKQNGLAALQKLDFTPDEAGELLSFMESGQSRTAWQVISQKLNSLNKEGSGSELHFDEMAALFKGLGASKGVISGLEKFFGENSSLNLNNLGLQTAFGGLATEMAAKNIDDIKLAKNLNNVLNDAVHQIKERQAREKSADKRDSGEINNSIALMRDSATGKGANIKELFGQNTEQNKNIQQVNPTLANNHSFEQETSKEQDKQSFKDSFAKKSKSAENILSELSAKSKNKSESSLSELFNKIDISAGSLNNITSLNNNISNLSKTQEGMRQSAFHEAIFSQVEQGLFQKMQNGTNQMVLHLDPVDLGQVTLLVSVNQGEVRATLRADSPEAAQSLQDQIPRMQALLESQGFKVQKLDVQTQMSNQDSNNNASNWQGLEQHNSGQERHEALLRQMNKLNALGKNALAQDVHNQLETNVNMAEIARQIIHQNSSLYVVA